jgi:hypothetical protein
VSVDDTPVKIRPVGSISPGKPLNIQITELHQGMKRLRINGQGHDIAKIKHYRPN